MHSNTSFLKKTKKGQIRKAREGERGHEGRGCMERLHARQQRAA